MINRCKLVHFNVLVEFVMHSVAGNTMLRDMMIRLPGEQGQEIYGFRVTQYDQSDVPGPNFDFLYLSFLGDSILFE